MTENWTEDKATGFWWNGDDGPYDNKWRKVPYKVDEILPVVRDMVIEANTAGLITIGSDGFPRCRTVTVGKHVADDFTEVTVATRKHTRKCEDISSTGKATMFWQEKSGMGAWVSAAGNATIEPGEDDKAKVRISVQRVEVQDYNANITGCGTDCWKPLILERQGGAWIKVQ
eukprot:gnl/MRDRNA2_/MRDRNA2_90057_c0_seq1.p1 gnl/MRDRNA2_/MRDRNA2_90057_c0~~gnl/MRDRNA2_/MRDRNA2_90057_c0_seq1.p1  ORF type:complete len:172 (-),score=35.75 gnl/MRDRNA2_/MRDRNA2_90057_c0_seq1:187-702(-)